MGKRVSQAILNERANLARLAERAAGDGVGGRAAFGTGGAQANAVFDPKAVAGIYAWYDVSTLQKAAFITSSQTTNDTDGGVTAITMPGGIIAGELLLAIVAHKTTASITQSGGSDWTRILDVANSGGVGCQLSIFAKIAAGSDTLTITDNGDNQPHSIVTMRIGNHGVSNVSSDIKLGIANLDVTASADPPILDAGVSATHLWLAAIAYESATSVNLDDVNYVTVGQPNINSILCAVLSRYKTAPTENPGSFSRVSSGSSAWIAQTIAIPPARVTPLDNDVILTMPDISGAVKHVDLYASLDGALYRTQAIGGRPALWSGNTTAQRALVTRTADGHVMNESNLPMSIFFTARRSNSNAAANMWQFGTNFDSRGLQIFLDRFGAGNAWAIEELSHATNVNSPSFKDDVGHLYTLQLGARVGTSVAVTLRVDRAQVASGTLTVSASPLTYAPWKMVSAFQDNDSFFGEILLYSASLANSDRDNIEAYLKSKWGTP